MEGFAKKAVMGEVQMMGNDLISILLGATE